MVPVPPLALTVTVESPPWHAMGVALELAVNAGGSVIEIEVVAVHALASVTVKVELPAFLLNGPVPLMLPVPPLALPVTVESPPLHAIGVALELAVNAGGSVIEIEVVAVHELASVTVKV